MPGAKQAWPNRAACWSPATPLIGTPAGRPGDAPRLRYFPAARSTGPLSGRSRQRHTEELGQLGIPRQRPDVEKQGARRVGGVGRVHGSAGQPPQQPAVDGPEGQLGSGRRLRPRGAATPAWWPRSTGRGPARCGRGPGRGDRRLPAPGTCGAPRRSCHTMARCRACRCCRSHTTDRLPLVGDADGRDRLGLGRASRPARWRRRRPDLLGVVLDPARPGEVLRELLVAGSRGLCRPRRRPWPGRRSCRRRGRSPRPWQNRPYPDPCPGGAVPRMAPSVLAALLGMRVPRRGPLSKGRGQGAGARVMTAEGAASAALGVTRTPPDQALNTSLESNFSLNLRSAESACGRNGPVVPGRCTGFDPCRSTGRPVRTVTSWGRRDRAGQRARCKPSRAASDQHFCTTHTY